MEHTLSVLRGAKDIAGTLPIPYVDTAVGVALNIIQLAKEVKDAKDECKALAERAAKYTRDIYEQLKTYEKALDGQSDTMPLEELLSTLQQIEAKMARYAGKSEKSTKSGKVFRTIKIIWQRHRIIREISKLTKQLDDAVNLFNTQTLMELEKQAKNSERANAAIIAIGQANQNMLISLVEADKYQIRVQQVELQEELDRSELAEDARMVTTAEASSSVTQAVTWYRGTLRKDGCARAVLVKRYQKKEEDFTTEVAHAKKAWHPNILQFLGYCPDTEAPFLVYNLACHVGSFEAMSRAIRGVKKFMWVIDATKQILEGLHHLATKSADIKWTPDSEIDPITGGSDLIVTSDMRVLLDTIRMDKIARTHVRQIKKEPLADVPPWKRRSALCALWRQFSSFVDFERDASVVWTTRRIACPGECFLWSTKEILEGLCYEEQLQYRTLSTRFAPAWLFPFSVDLGDKQTNTPSKGKSRRGQRKKQRPAKHQVETVEVVYEVPCGDLLCDAPPDYVARETWRRHTVCGLDHGWCLQTATTVRAIGDCSGWFINQGVRLRDLPLDPADMAIATGLRFTTQTYLVDMFDKCGTKKPPSTLYFYERVHDYPRATLDVDARLEWPWSYWSTDPQDRLEIERLQDAHRSRAHSIAFVGLTQEGTFRWMQIVEDCLMHIDVRVEVEHCRYTPDECLVLEEIQEAAIAEDEHIQSRDRWSVEDESDAASDLSDVWEEEDIQVGSRAPNHEGWVDDDDEKEPIDEESVADGLFWLRVGKEPGRPYTIDELEERLKDEEKKRSSQVHHKHIHQRPKAFLSHGRRVPVVVS
ncbi:hypothetical protein ONZ51_g8498 [Trametes cubensis]|uniref:Serine-threonine/tyrosine-protein kinase catalytic domain-containing protein n=1 Tax=Trametes cubensis TaxID=1111947 RepID=A0AAD7TN58_9APHY|nr:hypothetical protein ONZ51_g8498 [Trametes cubensis]